MSKKISAGDTLTVGDLTDDHLGEVIEVGPIEGITHRFRLDRVEHDNSRVVTLLTAERGVKCAHRYRPVKVITPPPVVQPDEPTELGQCISIEGDDGWLGIVVDPQDECCRILDTDGNWLYWDLVLSRAGERRIIVSDPPRWPDETPVVPERIEKGEWPNDDTQLRAWEWIERHGHPWRWNAQLGLWESEYMASDTHRPLFGPWTRGERVK